MTTRVIILAQGQQKRLPTLTLAKQMLPLPACGNTPILHRTLRQLSHLRHQDTEVAIVGWMPLVERLLRDELPLDRALSVGFATLPDPGNSSLKGIARYLSRPATMAFDRHIVLLGDVVYSWACLRQILEPAAAHQFVGTRDLSTNAGELWGISWRDEYDPGMREALGTALAQHPPFSEYQPGQLRRWLWAFTAQVAYPRGAERTHGPIDALARMCGWYAAIDDYTRDIDLPEHVEAIGALSELAAADDREHGVTW